jgi:hypothetical protein
MLCYIMIFIRVYYIIGIINVAHCDTIFVLSLSPKNFHAKMHFFLHFILYNTVRINILTIP